MIVLKGSLKRIRLVKSCITLSFDDKSGGWFNFVGSDFEACRMSAGLRNGCKEDCAGVGTNFIQRRCCSMTYLAFQSSVVLNAVYSIPLGI
jgi:hypothetical protein